MSDAIDSYIVAGRQPWNRKHFSEVLHDLLGNWYFAETPEELLEQLAEIAKPRSIFFLHWSEKVPESIIDKIEYVCFHMTDLPFGRGGSPLQNLISRGITETKITAIKMTGDFDAEPIYKKRDLSLKEGNAHEIYQRASFISCEMVKEIFLQSPTPKPQEGPVTVFRRRKPEESDLSSAPVSSLRALHDHIRMLEAPSYPHAHIDIAHFRIQFSSREFNGNEIKVYATIKNIPSFDS